MPNRRSEPRKLEMMLDESKGYRTGKVLAQGFGPDSKHPAYTLLQGDITDAYSDKVKRVIRSSVFLNLDNAKIPAAFVVFDQVVSSNAEFRKTWLLHTLQEPRIDGSLVIVDNKIRNQQGRLYLNALLPVMGNALIEKIGGPGKEYWVGDKNYSNEQKKRAIEKSSQELGKWRVEISPKKAAEENCYLNVMQVTDQSNEKPYSVERLEFDDMIGCRIGADKGDWIVLFRKNVSRSSNPVKLSLSRQQNSVLLSGLEAGRWKAVSDKGETLNVSVDEESGSGWLDLVPREWLVSKIADVN